MGQIVFFGKELKEGRKTWDNRREINVFLDKGMHRIITGIYKLHLDDHYYIGRANNVRTRIKQHMKDMEYMIHYNKEKGNGQKNMLKYLIEHPECNKMRVEILEQCDYKDLENREQFWIDKHDGDNKMLNALLKVNRTKEDVARAEFTPGIYKIEYEITDIHQYLLFKKKVSSEYGVCGNGLVKKINGSKISDNEK
jgi:hypothetical protein